MVKMKKKQLLLFRLCALAIFAMLSVLLFLGQSDLSFPYFSNQYSFSSVNGIGVGSDGTLLAVDNGNTALLEIDKNGELVQKISGGSMRNAFYYGVSACQDSRGNLYLCDIIYGEHGNRLESERIIRLNGSERQELLTIDYSEGENPPMQYGNILELRIVNDEPCYVYDTGSSIDVFAWDGTQWQCLNSFRYPESVRVNSASYDAATQTLVFSGKNGHIYTYIGAEQQMTQLPDYTDGQIAMAVTTSDGKAYIASVVDSSIYVWDESAPTEAPALFCQCDTTPFRLAVSESTRELIFSDQEFFYALSLDDAETLQVYESAPYLHWFRMLLLRSGVVFWAGLLLYFVVLLTKRTWKAANSNPNKEEFRRMILVAIPSILVASFVAYSIISTTTESKKEKQIDELKLFSEVLASQVDMESLAQIRETADGDSDVFSSVKEPLDQMIDAAYEIEDYYYYILLRPYEEAGYIELIMDYEDNYPCRMPAYVWEDNEYVEALTTGKEVLVEGGVSSFGSWTYTLVPLRDSSGKVTELLEVGMNFDHLRKTLDESVKEICFGTAAGAVVVTMFVMELLFLIGYYEKKRALAPICAGITVPLRFITFTVYMTDCMQDAFIAIMCADLYQAQPDAWFHGLAEGIAIALPMSAQLFVAAAASVIGGHMTQRRGPKFIMLEGFTLGVLGFALCAAGLGYNGILAGKCLFGFGQGLIYVAANALSGAGENEEARAQGYADVAAGVLSGVTIGVGLGSIVLSIGSYRTVYIVGAFCMLVGLVLSVRSKSVAVTAAESEEKQSVGIASALQFLSSKRVWPFLLLVLTPFMVALSFRDYLFPLYANEANISEVRIGQIYLLFGMAVLYVGPSLAKLLIDRLGARYSVATANVLMIAAIGIFAVHPSLVTILIGVGLLYISISFAYACQYYYFEELPDTKTYGVGGAFGIYSMFENIGQTIGPIIFGTILLAGFSVGGMIIAGALLALLALFILVTHKKEGNVPCSTKK